MLLARSFRLVFKLNMDCTAQHSCHASAHVSLLQAGVAIFRSAAWPISGTEAHRATVHYVNFCRQGGVRAKLAPNDRVLGPASHSIEAVQGAGRDDKEGS